MSIGRGARLALTLLGAAALTAAAAFLPIGDLAHAKKTKPAKNLVVAPKSGQKFKRSPVRISVRAPWKVRRLWVRLNGQSLTDEFRRAEIGKRGRRTVRVSASHGLRYGINVLRVTKKRVTRKRRSQRVRFTLTRDRPLVGAGRDRRVEVGRSIRLSGHASRGRDAPRARQRRSHPPGSPAGLEMRWRLVRKPADSKARLLRDRPAKPSRPQLKGLDEPGRYVVELIVIDRGVRSLADRVTITVVLHTPLVPIDTAATVEGQRGIAVGYHPAEQGGRAPRGLNEQFFPLGDGHLLQLVVLDRESLETVPIKMGENFYSLTGWSGPTSDASIAELTSLLKELEDKNGQPDDTKLAIVTAWCNGDCDESWAFAAHQPTQALVNTNGQGVNLIGAARLSPAQIEAFGLENTGQLSWIGVPGFSPGEAWEARGLPYSGGIPTSLDGFLSPDDNENYAYLGTEPTTYDLGPDGQSVSMQIGSNEFSGSLPAGQGGFLVAYLVATTLQPAEMPWVPQGGKAVYATRNADGSPNYQGMGSMASDLGASSHEGLPLIVAIRSIGPAPLARIGNQPPDYQGSFDPQYRDALNRLAGEFSAVGATRQLIWGMATNPCRPDRQSCPEGGEDSYSLLGSNALSNEGLPAEGSGADLGSQLQPEGQSRLAGILVRDKQSRYEPRMTANQQVGGALAALAVAEPSEWPLSSTAGEQAALRCIGQAQGLGPNPRVAYWLQDFDGSVWEEIKDGKDPPGIANMRPSACPDVDAADFKAVREELATEIGWLIRVLNYTEKLTQPFSDVGLQSYAYLKTITDNVYNEVKPPPTKQTGIDGLAIIADVLDLLADFDVPGAGAIAGSLFLAEDLSAARPDGPTIDWGQRVEAESDKIGEELANELAQIAAGKKQLARIIAADYAKLSTVGRLGGCDSQQGEDECPDEWQFDDAQQTAASQMYEITAERKIWAGLLPAAYPYVLYVNSNPNSYSDPDSPGFFFLGPQDQISNIRCRDELVPRDFHLPFPVSTPVFLRYGIFEDNNTGFLVFSQSNYHGRNQQPDATWPSPGLLKPLFTPRDEGGKALDQYGFMIDTWPCPSCISGSPPPSSPPTRVEWVGC